MTSLQTRVKQIPANAGYYVNVGNCTATFYANTGTDDAPAFDNRPLVSSISSFGALGQTVSTTLVVAGSAVFRDMGKTLISSQTAGVNARVFRKVQLMVANTSSVTASGTDGVKQVSNALGGGYLTGFIELPGQGTGSGTPSFTPVARLG
jgi:hypothetical protein